MRSISCAVMSGSVYIAFGGAVAASSGVAASFFSDVRTSSTVEGCCLCIIQSKLPCYGVCVRLFLFGRGLHALVFVWRGVCLQRDDG